MSPLLTDFERGQWGAFDRVLNWINEQEALSIRKTDLYGEVMKMRPKMKNGPELWNAVLDAVKTVYPQAIIAGGAVRDYLLGFEPKDVDVFVVGEFAPIEHEAFTQLQVPDNRRSEYEGVRYVQFVDDYEAFGHQIQIVVLLDRQVALENLVETFDLGITRCWYDGQVHTSREFVRDYLHDTITILLNDRPERSQLRAERFAERHAGQFTIRNAA